MQTGAASSNDSSSGRTGVRFPMEIRNLGRRAVAKGQAMLPIGRRVRTRGVHLTEESEVVPHDSPQDSTSPGSALGPLHSPQAPNHANHHLAPPAPWTAAMTPNSEASTMTPWGVTPCSVETPWSATPHPASPFTAAATSPTLEHTFAQGVVVTQPIVPAPPVYAGAPPATVMSAATSTSQVYAAPTITYSTSPLTYAAPAATLVGAPVMTYAAPLTFPATTSQPLYNISPERFQLILAGQPLTHEEILAMTGAAPVTAQGTNAIIPAARTVVELVAPGVSVVADASTTAALATRVAPSTNKKSPKKKRSEKQISAKQKEKGCC